MCKAPSLHQGERDAGSPWALQHLGLPSRLSPAACQRHRLPCPPAPRPLSPRPPPMQGDCGGCIADTDGRTIAAVFLPLLCIETAERFLPQGMTHGLELPPNWSNFLLLARAPAMAERGPVTLEAHAAQALAGTPAGLPPRHRLNSADGRRPGVSSSSGFWGFGWGWEIGLCLSLALGPGQSSQRGKGPGPHGVGTCSEHLLVLCRSTPVGPAHPGRASPSESAGCSQELRAGCALCSLTQTGPGRAELLHRGAGSP